ncbi:MAG: tetratricopeptide repeat protein [Caldilineaceae bacterium]|nr:tetratricopeptide repeat protein [Caldilineaceae bacterium]
MKTSDDAEQFHKTLNEGARLLSQNRPGEAITKMAPLLEIDATDPDLAINLGGAYVLQRKWNKAASVLNKAVTRHPDNAMLWVNLGAAELGRLETSGPRQQERAIRAYQRALSIDPEAPNVHYHLGLIYKERGELNRATAFFQRALEVRPSDKDAKQWLDSLTRISIEEHRQRTQQQLHGEQPPSQSGKGGGQ